MSTVRTENLSNIAGNRTMTMDRLAQGVAFAWVNFQGAGTVAIRRSYNVASITDNGVGDYTVNFTTPCPDANYCVTGSSSYVPPEEGNIVVPQVAVAPNAANSRIAVGVPGTAGSTGLTVRDASWVHVKFNY